MNKYLIFAFKHYGIFTCNEVLHETGEMLLVGKFDCKGTEFTFIKHSKDIQLPS